jgi:hypothetical protein
MLALEGNDVGLANPPICCLVCLPHVKFNKKYLIVHEWFIRQLVIYKLVMGYIDLLIGNISLSHTSFRKALCNVYTLFSKTPIHWSSQGNRERLIGQRQIIKIDQNSAYLRFKITNYAKPQTISM